MESPIIGVPTIEMLDFLLSKGLSLNVASKYGTTPLSYAAYNGRLEMVKAMVARGADPKHKDKDGLTARDSALSGVSYNPTAAQCAEYLATLMD